jgi:hypothetical protein
MPERRMGVGNAHNWQEQTTARLKITKERHAEWKYGKRYPRESPYDLRRTMRMIYTQRKQTILADILSQ